MSAKDNITKYLEQLSLSQNADQNSIHGLHFGTEREAELTVRDIRSLLAKNDSMREALERISKMLPGDAKLGTIETEANRLTAAIDIAKDAISRTHTGQNK